MTHNYLIHLIAGVLILLTQQYKLAIGQNTRDEYTSDRKYYKEDQGLTEIPTDIPAEALEVHIAFIHFTKIEANMFANLSQCTFFSLGYNKISDIEPGAFNGSTAVTRILLYYNQIKELKPGIFTGLRALDFLNLFGNQISVVIPGTFDGLTALTELTLHQNQIRELKPGTFNKLTALSYQDRSE